MSLLRPVAASAVAALAARIDPVDSDTLSKAKAIVEDVQKRGVDALLEHARRLGDLKENEPYYLGPAALKEAYDQVTPAEQQLLRRVAGRIDKFARAQREAVRDVKIEVDGGIAGHQVVPVQRAGCYAPGGRHPLPSSVLMTVCTARAAGVASVVVASPRPTRVTLAAAHVAGADGLLAVGGAHAIAALAHGLPSAGLSACDVVVGPGSLWVTAAKQLVAGRTGIDMLAGPSECLVLADDTADAALVAADLIAQAEHDVHARPLLVTTDASLPARVEKEVAAQLASLPTAETARAAFVANGLAVVAADLDEAVRTADSLAPEHLELHARDAANLRTRVRHAGAVFVGSASAEVLGDYGAGPNHVLPTGGTARYTGGLSVMHFVRFRSYLQLDAANASFAPLCADAAALARLEGLEGHARAADLRAGRVAAKGAGGPSAGLGVAKDDLVRIGLPKGRMEANVLKLLDDAGIKVVVGPRGYRPTLNIAGFDVKMLKPHNIVEMLHAGSREVGFTGADLVDELSAHELVSLLDTQLDPVRLVAAAPDALLGANKELPRRGLNGRPLVVATEYLHTTARWLKSKGIEGRVVHSRGATEGWPPEDADLIVDNCATGSTLKANALTVIEDIATSSTHLYCHPSLLQNPHKKAAVDRLVTMLRSVLAARDRMLLEFHVPSDRLQDVLAFLPAMKQPTVATLHNNAGYALKIAAPRAGLHEIFARLKAHGCSDIIATALQHVVP